MGLIKKKVLNLREIELEMKTTQDSIKEHSKSLEPGHEAGLFIGVGIVVLKS